MDDEQFLLHPYLHPVPGGLPPPHRSLLQVQKVSRRTQCRLRPPEPQPGLGQTPTIVPLPLLPQSPGLVQTPHDRPLLRLPPPQLAHEGPLSPPIMKHLPVDALAHLTLPLQVGLTRLPLVLHAPPPTRDEHSPPRTHEENLPSPSGPR